MKGSRKTLLLLVLVVIVAFVSGKPRSKRLAGGVQVQKGQFPYVVAIKDKDRYICGGVIIGPTKILTAATCTTLCRKENDIENCKKQMTIVTDSPHKKDGTAYKVIDVAVPQSYQPKVFDSDVAVITLESELKLSEDLKAVELPTGDVVENSTANVAGWGFISREVQFPEELQILKQKIISNDKCRELLDTNKVTSNDLCAVPADGSSNAGLCQGDSGSPIVADGKVIGIATWGKGCAAGYPDVYTNVFKYVDFIKSNLSV